MLYVIPNAWYVDLLNTLNLHDLEIHYITFKFSLSLTDSSCSSSGFPFISGSHQLFDINGKLQVLDEIHRQPMSVSLSVLSLPAPESVVDSFPVKSYSKSDEVDTGNNVPQ